MSVTLYRRMSVDEANGTLASKKILPPNSHYADKRKWFTTTLFVSCWSHNPYLGSSTEILKVTVEDSYFQKILECGEKMKSGFRETDNPYVYVMPNDAIGDFYNVGVTDLDELNAAILSISPVEGYYEETLQEEILKGDLRQMPQDWSALQECEYFVQVPYDVAIMMVAYQTVMREALFINTIHFSKDKKYLERVNFGNRPVTLRVLFGENIKNMTFYDEITFALEKSDFFKIMKQIRGVKIYDVGQSDFVDSKEKFSSTGLSELVEEDLRGKTTEVKPLKEVEGINFSKYEAITAMLFKKNFTLESLYPFADMFRDMEGIVGHSNYQILSLKSFVEKSVRMSNLVLNYLKDAGNHYSTEELIRIKWELLLNSIAKPYCERKERDCYIEYIGFSKLYQSIVGAMFIDDFGFDLRIIDIITGCDENTGFKRICKIRKSVLEAIMTYYTCSSEEALQKLISYIRISFACKISKMAALKPKRFYKNFVSCLRAVKTWEDSIFEPFHVSLGIDYESLYFDYKEAYYRIIEGYYLEENETTREMVWKLVEEDYNDLCCTYEALRKCHHLNDETQIDYDYLVGNFFREGDSLVKKYFMDSYTDKSPHGKAHSDRVGVYAYLLGKLRGLSDEEIEILLIAAKLHDIGRVHDDEDAIHGLRSSLIAKKLGLLGKSANRRYIYFLMEAHSLPDEEKDACMKRHNLSSYKATLLYDIFKDADALDRVRFDKKSRPKSALDLRFLRTGEARCLVKFAYLLNAAYRMDKRELAPSIQVHINQPLK